MKIYNLNINNKVVMVEILLSMMVFFCFTLCSMVPFKTKVSSNEKQLSEQIMQKNTKNSNKLKIKIGEKTFTATLSDNPTAAAFKALLPLSLNMNELNNNEKFAQLPKSVPINASVPTNIQSGDLMMYGSNTLVLFYKGFSTSYSYTKIGKIDDVTGLVNALGTGDIKVHLEIEKD